MSADHGGLFTVPINECSWKPLYTDAAAATSSIETSDTRLGTSERASQPTLSEIMVAAEVVGAVVVAAAV